MEITRRPGLHHPELILVQERGLFLLALVTALVLDPLPCFWYVPRQFLPNKADNQEANLQKKETDGNGGPRLIRRDQSWSADIWIEPQVSWSGSDQ